MKKIICLAVGLFTLGLAPIFGQQTRAETDGAPTLTKFNLDFPGGTPAQLVSVIEKASGKALNAIIPTEDADIQLPPLKMNDVVTPQLFVALRASSQKTVAIQNQMFGQPYSQVVTDYGFVTSDSPVTDSSIWYFHADKPSLPPVGSTERICKFYNLDPYLNRGFTVDDITTAIQTGWKMAGITSPAKLDYHKETKLLIAFGEPSELETIQDVLQTLPATKVYLGDVEDLRAKVYRLQKQVDDLAKKFSSLNSSAHSSSQEKSGK